MIVYTGPALVPMLLSIGVYFLFGMFLDDVNAFGVAAIIGSAVSAMMEFGGIRGTVFFLPVGLWLGAGALEAAFRIADTDLVQFESEPGIAIMIMSVVATLFGLASLLGMIVSRGPEDDGDDEGDDFMANLES